MTRRISCSMTVDAVRDRSKTVTRRHVDTWKNLKVGDRLTIVEKAMGLPKGAHQVQLADVEITDVRVERLGDMSYADCAREGFPEMTPFEFMLMWAKSHGYTSGFKDGPLHEIPCRRIEWRYVCEACDDLGGYEVEVSAGDVARHGSCRACGKGMAA